MWSTYRYICLIFPHKKITSLLIWVCVLMLELSHFFWFLFFVLHTSLMIGWRFIYYTSKANLKIKLTIYILTASGQTSGRLPWCVPADSGLPLQELFALCHLQHHRGLLPGGHYLWEGKQASGQTEQDEVESPKSAHSSPKTTQQHLFRWGGGVSVLVFYFSFLLSFLFFKSLVLLYFLDTGILGCCSKLV